MVIISCATFLFALLSVSIAEDAEEVSHSLPNVHQTKTAEKYKRFTLSTRTVMRLKYLSALDGKNTENDLVNLTYMTAQAWIKIAADSNRQALEILKSLTSEQGHICTMIENVQNNMKIGSETTLHVMTALTLEKESVKALLYLIEKWDSSYKVVATHLTRALAALVSAGVLKNATSDEGNQDAALKWLYGKEQPVTAEKAVELAEKVLKEFVEKLPAGALNTPNPLLNFNTHT